jgi:zinc/manganese transport system permease protein
MFSDFLVNTWITASVVAVVAGLVGFFVVLRESSWDVGAEMTW